MHKTIRLRKSSPKLLNRHMGSLIGFCLLWLISTSISAQNLSKKTKSLEPTNNQPSITVNGQTIPLAGHNNVNKLIRMAEKNGGAQQPFPGLEDLQSRETYEWMMLRDPRTNTFPVGIREKELEFAKILLAEQTSNLRPGFDINDKAPWKRRGPYNVGGRTRALAIDQSNTNRILAGGVSGGMWLSVDGGDSWTKTTNSTDLQAVSCIAQDPTDETGNTWYYGTGEIRGNSAAANGAPLRGDGIFKSVDGGLTWAQLQSTASGTPHIFDGDFDYVHNIAVDPTSGDVWAAAFGSIFMSDDGGVSWDTLFTGGGTWSDVEITPTGDVYLTIEPSDFEGGIWYKDAAVDTFANITPPEFLLGNMDRTVLSVAPSDENIVYFLGHTPGSGVLSTTLMKYVHSAGDDSTGFMGTWEDRSANVPAFGGSVGNYNSQGAYNQVIKVHPSNPDIVFIGGTNLYRSTDGFSTSNTTTWIGGYGTVNNVSLYPNQHPDQHAFVFYPDNPSMVLSGNDGGVYKTLNVLENDADETPVNWLDLNNGYYTTQPYAISIDPTAENPDLLMAGFQDNGTWLTTDEATEAIWTEEFGGDGSFNAMADGGRTRLVSSQNGNTYAFYYEDANDPESLIAWTRIVPAGAAGFSFVNPFILDPNDDKVVYMASSRGIWRNSDYTEIPDFNPGTTSVNWSQVPGTSAASGVVTTLEASTFAPNIVYFGTSFGEVWKVENANTSTPIVTNVSGSSFLGSISSIAVDPKDADRVIVAISNYNVRSIFYSEDGGDTWVDVGGNLEEAADGDGPGPSVRWVEMLETDEGFYYLAGTSTGLYSTQVLEIDDSTPEETVWELESPDLMGNVVIRHMAVRPQDGTIAIATHANGMYQTQLPVTQKDRIIANKINDIDVVFGTDSLLIDIAGLFMDEGTDNSPLEIELFKNTNDSLLSVELDLENDIMTLIFSDTVSGSTSITLKAASDDRIATSSFAVNVKELEFGFKPVFDQITNPGGVGIPSQVFTDLGGPVWAADDFEVPEGDEWRIAQVIAPGTKNQDPLGDVVVQFWLPSEDSLALPEIIIFSDTVTSANGPDDGNLKLNLREELVLNEGYYWVSITPILPFNNNGGRWFWNRTEEGFGNQYHLIDPANLFDAGLTSWTPGSFFNESFVQLNFSLNGVSNNQPPTPLVESLFAEAESPYEINLSWDASIEHLAYIIYASDDGENYEKVITIPAKEENGYEFSGLEPNSLYHFGIAAIDVVGDTTTMAFDSTFTFPEVPVITEASDVTDSSFVFEWNIVSADGFIVYLADENETVIFEDSVSADVSTYMMDGLDGATTYLYSVAAINASSGFFDIAEPKSVFTLPPTPDNLMVSDIMETSAEVSWETVSQADSYTIDLATDEGFTSSIISDSTISTTNIALSELDPNTAFFVRVKANALDISSKYSDVVSFMTFPVPNAPINVTGFRDNQGNNQVSWELTEGDVVDYILIERSPDNTQSAYAPLDSLVGAVTSYTDSSLPTLSTWYSYRVKAGNISGTSPFSEDVVTGLNKELEAGLSIWPNPTQDKVQVMLNEIFKGQISINVINTVGQVIQVTKMSKTTSTTQIYLNLEPLPAGMYTIQVSTQKGFTFKKILKQ